MFNLYIYEKRLQKEQDELERKQREQAIESKKKSK